VESGHTRAQALSLQAPRCAALASPRASRFAACANRAAPSTPHRGRAPDPDVW